MCAENLFLEKYSRHLPAAMTLGYSIFLTFYLLWGEADIFHIYFSFLIYGTPLDSLNYGWKTSLNLHY